MLALWDRHPELPYQAWAPWPKIEIKGYQDWETSVHNVDTWLVNHIGLRWVDWTWGWVNFSMNIDGNVCCVNFRRQRDTSLFLLRFG